MDINKLIEHFPQLCTLLTSLPPSIANRCILKTFPKGHIFHYKGDWIQTIHILYEGSVQVKNDFESGQSYVIEYNTPLDIIGDVCLLAKKDRASVTIEALSPCSTIQLLRHDFEEWLNQDSQLLHLMATRVAFKLYQSSSNHGTEIFYSAPQLLINFFLTYSYNHPSTTYYMIKLTRQEISDHLGISTRTINRTLKELKDQQLIYTKKGKICFSLEQKELLLKSQQKTF